MIVGSRFISVCCSLLVLAALVLVGGCGKGETNVKATVTYKGETIKSGGIELNSKPGRGGAIGEGGVVNLKNVPAGKWKVKFATDDKVEPAAAKTDKKIQDFATSDVEIEVKDGITNEFKIDFK